MLHGWNVYIGWHNKEAKEFIKLLITVEVIISQQGKANGYHEYSSMTVNIYLKRSM